MKGVSRKRHGTKGVWNQKGEDAYSEGLQGSSIKGKVRKGSSGEKERDPRGNGWNPGCGQGMTRQSLPRTPDTVPQLLLQRLCAGFLHFVVFCFVGFGGQVFGKVTKIMDPPQTFSFGFERCCLSTAH